MFETTWWFPFKIYDYGHLVTSKYQVEGKIDQSSGLPNWPVATGAPCVNLFSRTRWTI